MDMQTITGYLAQYGGIAVFIIVFLEYMNLPGFPAGIIMPLAGIWAAQGGLNFVFVLFLSVLAGLCGSWVLYLVGRLGGMVFLERIMKRFPKTEGPIRRTIDRINKNGYLGVFACKLIPAVRTIISIPAGVLGMNFGGYTFFSMMGITVWNLVFIGAGYLFGDTVFTLLPF